MKALNEYSIENTNWRKKLDSQRGAVLATELRNNANKLARWTSRAILSSVDSIVLGYVTRVQPKDNYNHVVMGTQYYKPSELANQCNLKLDVRFLKFPY